MLLMLDSYVFVDQTAPRKGEEPEDKPTVNSYDDDYDEVCGFAVNPMYRPERNRVSALHANNS